MLDELDPELDVIDEGAVEIIIYYDAHVELLIVVVHVGWMETKIMEETGEVVDV